MELKFALSCHPWLGLGLWRRQKGSTEVQANSSVIAWKNFCFVPGRVPKVYAEGSASRRIRAIKSGGVTRWNCNNKTIIVIKAKYSQNSSYFGFVSYIGKVTVEFKQGRPYPVRL